MASGQTIFITYSLDGAPYSANTAYGFSKAIHCRYITTLTTDTLIGKKLGLYFNPTTLMPFLAGTGSTAGTGFTATGISAIVQVVSGITDTSGTTISPVASGWTKYDVTDQIAGHVVGQRINPANLLSSAFTIDINNNTGTTYNLNYLNYPTQGQSDSDNLPFGDEAIFFGTVETDIRARIYATDIPIVLPLHEFNNSTNPTWNGNEPVYITEIGIYDDAGRLVAKGKLNFPIRKDSNVARTIVFGLDF